MVEITTRSCGRLEGKFTSLVSVELNGDCFEVFYFAVLFVTRSEKVNKLMCRL